MILDILPNLELYHKNIPYYQEISDFLKNDLSLLQLGRHTIIDDDVIAIVSEFSTLSEEDSVWESHRKYLDLHLVIHGTEKIYWNTVDVLSIVKAYNEAKDSILFSGDSAQSALLRPGYFVLFYPGDAHKVKCMVNYSEEIRKIVVKIKLP